MTFDFATTFASLGASEPVVATAPDVPGYGSDLDCITDLTADFAELDGGDPQTVVNHFLRMLMTPRGSVVDAPDVGIDLRSWLHRGITQRDIGALQSLIAGVAAEDDRIASLDPVGITPAPDGSSMTLTISGTLAASSQTFALVAGLTDAGLLLREMAVQ